MELSFILKPVRIGSKTAPNRIVYQPTEANNCDDEGSPTRYTHEKYVAIARGNPGVIHIESIDVTTSTQARSNRMLIMEKNLKGLEALLKEIRAANNLAPVIFQLSHAGRLSDPAFKPRLGIYNTGDPSTRVMTTAEIELLEDEFVTAARRAYQVGADGIDFKQAHGFIGDDFLHPANRREDRYGGSFENRTRFFRETFRRMREEIGDPNFIIGSRISPYEAIPGGFGTAGPEEMTEDLSEPIAFAQLMESEGIDFINVSAGFAAGNLEILMPTRIYPEGVFRLFGWTRRIKEAVKVPVIGSGYSHLANGANALFIEPKEHRSLLYWAEKNLRDGATDLIGIGRQAIADPEFAKKVAEGKIDRIKWCTTCGDCGMLLGTNKRVGCTIFDREYRTLLAGSATG